MFKGKAGLLLAAAAAYGVYRYTKLTPEKKESLKAKGKDLADKYLGDLNLFGTKKPTTNGSGY